VLGLHRPAASRFEAARWRGGRQHLPARRLRDRHYNLFRQAAATSATDDGNQIMWQLLAEDIVIRPSLVPKDGALPISGLPGLGFELNRDAVARAAEACRKL
jgi:hypothetical protein